MTDDDGDGDVVPSQPGLIGAVLLYLDRAGVKAMTARQMTAVIAAATDIMAALDRPDVPAAPGSGLDAWLRSDDTGLSSLYLASVLGGRACRPDPQVWGPHPWPRDPADFGRCVRMLDAAPDLRPLLPRMLVPEHGPAWNAMAAAWAELEALYREESPGGACPRLFARMNEMRGVAERTGG